MKKSSFVVLISVSILVLISFGYAEEARLLRQPTVSENLVAFVYANDIWTVSRSGTSALITASSTIGAQLAGSTGPIIEKYRAFGHHLGLAFQVQDDILGIWGDPEKTGKPASDDLRQRKKNLPTLYGIAKSPSFADLFFQESKQVHVQDLFEALNQVDALDHAQDFSHKQTETALQALQEAEPREPAARELKNIAHRLTHRQS